MTASKLSSKKKLTHKACCEPSAQAPHPSHSELLPRLNRVNGQLAGIQKMIQQERYCVDILVQLRATLAALRAIEVSVFEKHLKHCVSSALLSHDPRQVEEKIKELTELLSRRTAL